jgi:ABC-2 type transport system ATP-binding protein
VTSSRSIRDFIKNDLSKKAGKTVLYTTQYIEEVSQMCDRVAILNRGKLVALDTPDALKGMTKKGEVADIVVKKMSGTQISSFRSMTGVTSLNAEA